MENSLSQYFHKCQAKNTVAAYNHVLLIDFSPAVTSYQGFAKFSAALSLSPNWSLPEANWLDCSAMSKSISQLNEAGRWSAVIAATAAACRLWPCGETELEMSPLNLQLPWNIEVWLLTGCQTFVCLCSVTWFRHVHAWSCTQLSEPQGCRGKWMTVVFRRWWSWIISSPRVILDCWAGVFLGLF